MRLDPADRRSVGFAQILDELSKQRRPVYLELDPETSAIMRLRIPHVTRVVALHSIDDGVDVELERSHARHVLRRGAPDFDELERKLREALDTRAPVILTESDAHEVIDVRGYSPARGAPLSPFPEEPGASATGTSVAAMD